MKPTDPRLTLAPYLQPSERLLWAGKPAKLLVFRHQDAFIIPFSIVWVAITISGFFSSDSETWFVSIPFVGIGLYLLFGRFMSQARVLKKTFYGVAEGRVLILRNKEITSLALKNLSGITLKKGRAGIGTITFGVGDLSVRKFNSPLGLDFSRSEFLNIPDAQKIYDLIISKELQQPL